MRAEQLVMKQAGFNMLWLYCGFLVLGSEEEKRDASTRKKASNWEVEFVDGSGCSFHGDARGK